MSSLHVPQCDCAECLPGFPAAPTRVYVDERPLLVDEHDPSDYVRDRRREQIRRANRKWRANNIEAARQATREWREANPAKVQAGKSRARRRQQIERLLERFEEGSTAAE